MAQIMERLSVCLLLLLMVGVVAEAAPDKPKQVKCQDKTFPDCYHQKLLCPDSCLQTCVVDCATCQPVCTLPSPPPTTSTPPLSPPPTTFPSPPPPPITTTPPLSPPPTTFPSPPPPPIITTPPLSPPPTTFPSPPPPPTTSTPPSSSPPPAPITSSPPSWHPPPPPDSSEAAAKRVKCKNKYYPHCYDMELTCPSSCPSQCEVDCVTCSPVCSKYLSFPHEGNLN